MWQGIAGHDAVVEQFRQALAHGRLASTFLFVGPPGIGKRSFADKLAQSLLCPHTDPHSLVPCGACDSCVQAAAGTHPDLIVIRKPADKSFIPLAAFVGDDNRRMRDGLCHDIALKPFMGGRKVAIIDDADHLNEESANALLKTLEEPPPRSVLILIGTSADRQLPTIRSRAQTIRFRPLPADDVARILLDERLASDESQARRMAEFSSGSVMQAVDLADEQLWTFRAKLLAELARPQLANVLVASETVAFVDAAGKEAQPRRARARQIVGFAVEFHRQVMRGLCGLKVQGDAELIRSAETAVIHWHGDVDTAAGCLERSLEALAHIDRNAHQATLIECWLDDLARVVATGRPVPAYRE